MVEFLTLLTIFVRPVYSLFLLVFNIEAKQGQLAGVYIAVAVLDYLYLFINHLFRYKVKGKFWVSCIGLLGILCAMVLTGIKYHGLQGEYLNSIFSFASLSISGFLLGYALVQKKEYRVLGKWLAVFVLLLTGLSAYADLSTIGSWDGLIHAELTYDINYQNCTYYAAYALGLTLFYLINSKEFGNGKGSSIIKTVFVLAVPLQVFVIFTAGGRGGFLLGVFLVLYYLVIYIIKNTKYPAYYVVGLFAVCMLAAVLVVYLGKNGNDIRGFSRITNFLKNREDKSREQLYQAAVESFLQSPLWGKGLGSVWFEVGYYSHNVFCDMLCESGVLGIAIVAYGLTRYFYKEYHMVKNNSIHQFGLLIFICVFVMLMFSGYYFTEPMLWFALGYTFCADIQKKEDDNETIACRN